jgi:hypothetical protein
MDHKLKVTRVGASDIGANDNPSFARFFSWEACAGKTSDK